LLKFEIGVDDAGDDDEDDEDDEGIVVDDEHRWELMWSWQRCWA